MEIPQEKHPFFSPRGGPIPAYKREGCSGHKSLGWEPIPREEGSAGGPKGIFGEGGGGRNFFGGNWGSGCFFEKGLFGGEVFQEPLEIFGAWDLRVKPIPQIRQLFIALGGSVDKSPPGYQFEQRGSDWGGARIKPMIVFASLELRRW